MSKSPKSNDRNLRNLSSEESEIVKSNINWSYFNRLFCSSFIRQLRKGNLDVRGTTSYATIIKETSPRQPYLQTYINAAVLGQSLHRTFTQSSLKVIDTYYTAIYKALAPFIKEHGTTPAAFNAAFDAIETFDDVTRDYVETVRQRKDNTATMATLLAGSKDRIVLVAHLLAFKSIVLTEGYFYEDQTVELEIEEADPVVAE